MKLLQMFLLMSLAYPLSLSAQQDTLWTRTFGGPRADGAESIIETHDGGYAVTGFTYSAGAGRSDVYLLKTDVDGNEEWTRTYGGPGWDLGFSVYQTGADSGYVVAGYTTSFGAGSMDLYLIKTDRDGNEVWSRTFGGELIDVGRSIVETSDGCYLVCGYTESFGDGEDDFYLLKVDAQGDEMWHRTYGGTGSDMGNSIIRTGDGNYLLCGSTGSTAGYDLRNVYIIKVDDEGETLWTRYFGRPEDYEQGDEVYPTSDGGYIIVGSGDDLFAELSNVYMVKTDPDGNRLWSSKFGTSIFYDYGFSAFEAADRGYIFAGSAKSAATQKNDVFLIKTDPDGYVEWSNTLGGAGDDWAISIRGARDGSYVVAGNTDSFGAGSLDVWLLKFERVETGIHDAGSPSVPLAFSLSQNYPNPFNPRTTIKFTVGEDTEAKLEIFSVRGKVVKTFPDFGSGPHSVVWDGRDDRGVRVSSGVYFFRLSTDTISKFHKMLLLK